MKTGLQGKWFEQNQKRLNKISEQEKTEALKELKDYLILNMKGRTLYGAHSARLLGIDPLDYYIEKALLRLFNGMWEWKDNRNLASQLKRIASGLLQKQVKKFRNVSEGKSKEDDVWHHMANMDVERMEYREEDDQREQAYDLILELVKGKPARVEYVLEVMKGGDYDEIAHAMGIEVDEVRLIERRVLRKLTAYRLKKGSGSKGHK